MPVNGPGILCPQCRKTFAVALISMLTSKTIECPRCGTEFQFGPDVKPLPPDIFDPRERSEREDDSGAG